jgi:hypothetical protein
MKERTYTHEKLLLRIARHLLMQNSFLKNLGFIFGWIIPIMIQCACTEHAKYATLDHSPVVAHRDDKGVVVCDIAAVKDTVDFPLSRIFSDLEVIQLENSDEAMVADEGNWISENHIGTYSFPTAAYKLFDRAGRYAGDITRHGQGPNEFVLGIYDSYIDETEHHIYILPIRAEKIMVFDMQGNPLRHIPLPYTVHKGRFKINVKEKTLVMMALPFSDTPSVIWKQDFDGRILQEIPSGQFVIDPGDYSNEVGTLPVQSTLAYFLSRWAPMVDSLYHYDESNNTLTPVFTAHFNGDVKMHNYLELSGYYLIGLIVRASPTSSMDYLKILIDKQTLRGSYVRLKLDMLGNIEYGYMTFHQGTYTASMHPSVLKEQLEAALAHPENLTEEIRQRITELNNSITDNDNNIILTGTLK